eukprot:6461122-Amphidinium_carterae.1
MVNHLQQRVFGDTSSVFASEAGVLQNRQQCSTIISKRIRMLMITMIIIMILRRIMLWFWHGGNVTDATGIAPCKMLQSWTEACAPQGCSEIVVPLQRVTNLRFVHCCAQALVKETQAFCIHTFVLHVSCSPHCMRMEYSQRTT